MHKVLLLVVAMALGGGMTPGTTRAQALQAKPDATKVCTVKVVGMTCAGCEVAVKLAAKQIEGVKATKASYAKGTAEVSYDPGKTAPDAIAKAITRKTGYKTELVK